jgi:hypothetical protein
MISPRRLAERLLSALRRRASTETEHWATAMLHELDYVDGDWSALWWALGGAAALCRVDALSARRVGKATVGVVSGALIAAGLMAICLVTLVSLPHMSWPQLSRSSVLERSIVTVGLETICAGIAAAVWRHRRSVATGALVAGTTVFLHVVTHG